MEHEPQPNKHNEDTYIGTFESPADAAAHILELYGAYTALDAAQRLLPPWLRQYVKVDVAAFAEDMPVDKVQQPDGTIATYWRT